MNEIRPDSGFQTRRPAATFAVDVQRIRADFPILEQLVHGKPLVFLDTAASAQKPNQVIDAMSETMRTQYANVHRGPALDERAHHRGV